MATEAALTRARSAFARPAWGAAYTLLVACDAAGALEPPDLERLAIAAFMVGEDEASAAHWERAHNTWLECDEAVRAARSAFWLAFGVLNRGEHARGGGWLARAQRLLEPYPECAEQGYLLLPQVLRLIGQGDLAGASSLCDRALLVSGRYGDVDLTTLTQSLLGRVLIRLDRAAEGVAVLDEAMIAVTAGEASPIVAGTVYCTVIEGCLEIFDMPRAQEWTAALSTWCDDQPDLVPYRGQCLVYRAELLQLHGDWSDAATEAERACERLAVPLHPALGAAYYRHAELLRLSGEFARAEEAYRLAHASGRSPQPGLALLRLAQGRAGNAAGAIRLAVQEAADATARVRLLPAHIAIMLAVGDVDAAERSAGELRDISRAQGALLLQAEAAQASGAVLLARGDARAAAPALREACALWQDLAAPYELARVRVQIASVCRLLGDDDTADLELRTAREAFEWLGAAPDLSVLDARTAAAPFGLSPRELEVLRLVAAGKTNKAIASDLMVSERTIDRHVSNIFGKIGVVSRSAATAFAFVHQLV